MAIKLQELIDHPELLSEICKKLPDIKCRRCDRLTSGKYKIGKVIVCSDCYYHSLSDVVEGKMDTISKMKPKNKKKF